jgi:hypothetical protein
MHIILAAEVSSAIVSQNIIADSGKFLAAI